MRRLSLPLVLAGFLLLPSAGWAADYDPATGYYAKTGTIRAGVVKSGCTSPLAPCPDRTVYSSVRKRTQAPSASFTLLAQYLGAQQTPSRQTLYVHQVRRVKGKKRYVRLLTLQTDSDGVASFHGFGVKRKGEFLVTVWSSPRRMVARQTMTISLDRKKATRFAGTKNFLRSRVVITPPIDL